MAARTSTTRSGKIVFRLVIVLVVLVGLVVAADRVGNVIAEKQAADKIRSSQDLTSTPDVSIGFPFLTKLASGNYGTVDVEARNVVIHPRGLALNLSRVHVALHHVTLSSDFHSVHADSADATALITYADLGQTVRSTVTFAGAGKVRARVSAAVLGQSASVTVTSKPTLVGGAINFGGTRIEGTHVPSRVLDLARAAFASDLPLDGIPFGVRVQALSVDAGGVHLRLSGRDLQYH